MLGNVLFCFAERGWQLGKGCTQAVPVPSPRLQCCLQLCVLLPCTPGLGEWPGLGCCSFSQPGPCQAPASEHTGATAGTKSLVQLLVVSKTLLETALLKGPRMC